mgnify:FL=1|tara:strand:+ start:3314 stop:4531 length:1218 start_codon:yes stop_codon:yes gene_type:complete
MQDNQNLVSLIKQFMPYAQKHIGFEKPPKLFLKQDYENAKNPLGLTAYYDPESRCVTLYVTNRHPKDILRSLGHELVHHKQNCQGKFANAGYSGKGYAQKNPHLRSLEAEANRDGSMCLRDFTDLLQENNTIYYEYLQKGANNMSTKKWKDGELKNLLSEAWGFKMDLSKLNETKKEYDLDENATDRIFAPSHYCAHHVIHEGRKAVTVDHNWDKSVNEVTEYDLKFEDGSIIRNVSVSDMQVVEGMEHGKRDDAEKHPKAKKAKKSPKAKKDYDGDGKVESGEAEFMGSRDKAIKKAKGDVKEASKTANRAVGRVSNGDRLVRGEGQEDELEEGGCGDMDMHPEEEFGADVEDGFGDEMDMDAIIDKILAAVEELRGLTGDVAAIEMDNEEEFMQELDSSEGGN